MDLQNNIKLCLTNYAQIPIEIDLSIDASTINHWKNDMSNYFKLVYRWDGNGEQNTPIINPKTGQITNLNLKNQNIINNIDEIKVTVKNKDIL